MRLNIVVVVVVVLTFGALVANPKKILYTVANPDRGLPDREKKKKRKSLAAHYSPLHAARSEEMK